MHLSARVVMIPRSKLDLFEVKTLPGVCSSLCHSPVLTGCRTLQLALALLPAVCVYATSYR